MIAHWIIQVYGISFIVFAIGAAYVIPALGFFSIMEDMNIKHRKYITLLWPLLAPIFLIGLPVYMIISIWRAEVK